MPATTAPEGLPAPTGRHQVGRTWFDWIDPDRAEIYSSDPGDRRELVVWVWYPAEPGAGARRAAYLPEPWAAAGQFLGLDTAGLLSNAVQDAPVAGEAAAYPVLVLSPSGFPPLLLAAVAEDLASHARWRLAERLDLDRLGAYGHSFGGNAALQWCRDDPRCRAAVNLDGAIWTEVGRVGLDRPALQLLAEHPEFALSGADAVAAGLATDAAAYDAEKAITFGGWRAVHEHARPSSTIQVEGATHLSFMDVPLLPLLGDSPARAMLAATRIDPRRMWRITCDVLLAFFATHLDGKAAPPPLAGPSADYPELRYGPP